MQKFHTDDMHYPDLGSASDWLCRQGIFFQSEDLGSARHQYGVHALVTQTSFCEGSSGDLAKRRLFSQATLTSTGILVSCMVDEDIFVKVKISDIFASPSYYRENS